MEIKLVRILKSKKTGNYHCPECLKKVKKIKKVYRTLYCNKCKMYYAEPEEDKLKEKEDVK